MKKGKLKATAGWADVIGHRASCGTVTIRWLSALPSADQAAEISRLQRENKRLRMEREILKNCPAPGAPVRGRNSLVLSSAAGRVAAVGLLEAQSPLKNMVHGRMRT